MTDLSNNPGIAAQAFISINLMLLPIVAFTLLPGPKRLFRELIPSLDTTGPLNISSIPAPPRLEEGPIRLNFGSRIASVAASTAGKYSGKHPAITALEATLSKVIDRRRSGISPTICEPGKLTLSRNSCILSAVGGTTGSPSVHPSS